MLDGIVCYFLLYHWGGEKNLHRDNAIKLLCVAQFFQAGLNVIARAVATAAGAYVYVHQCKCISVLQLSAQRILECDSKCSVFQCVTFQTMGLT